MKIKKLININSNDLISKMYLSIVAVMIFNQLATHVATIIDGVIASRYYGDDAFSAISLLGPLLKCMVMFFAIFASGTQIIAAGKAGKGEIKSANEAFSTSVISGLVITAVFCFLCIINRDMMFSICGVKVSSHPGIYDNMTAYLKGYLIGAPAIMLTTVISPLIVLDNGKKTVTWSTLTLCAVDIVGDLVNVFVFDGGNFGMGLASAIGYYCQLFVLLLHFKGKNSNYRFSFRISFSSFKEIMTIGSPEVVTRLSMILRDLIINRLNIAVAASAAAIAARSIQGNLNTLIFAFGMGISKTIVPMSAMYYGADDEAGLKRVYKVFIKYALLMSLAVGIIMFVFAKNISYIYTANEEVAELSAFSIRCLAVAMLFDCIESGLQGYLRGIKNIKLVNIITFCERLLVPLLTAIILGLTAGSKGVLASLAIGKIILAVILFIMICINCHGIPGTLKDLMFLPRDFGKDSKEDLNLSIKSLDEAVSASEQARLFALSHNISSSKAYNVALFIEELAINSIKHGSSRRRKCFVDINIHINADELLLTIRDNGNRFDITEYDINTQGYEKIGIRLVKKMAKEIQYFYTLNTNNIIISI